ncbi:MAG: ankyrin repeat domain-containing protein [Saprospiraceae bacterium]|jgi:ankyrin repeat protein|nr:ankyrin repeat domain-containing protein [Saprospiraceae bacterium]MBK8296459.1 ankyrin repeat domain-containing protein [Saprospiraceae bacterium]
MKKAFLSLLAVASVVLNVYSQQTLQSAIEQSDSRFVKEWIASGHDVNNILIVNDQKLTPLAYAALKANPEMVNLLLNRGAQVNQKTEFQDALMFAAMGGNTEIIETLLTAGANPMNENKMGKCARDLAKDAGHSAAHQLLSIETEKRVTAQRAKRLK